MPLNDDEFDSVLNAPEPVFFEVWVSSSVDEYGDAWVDPKDFYKKVKGIKVLDSVVTNADRDGYLVD